MSDEPKTPNVQPAHKAANEWIHNNWHTHFRIAGSDNNYVAYWAFVAGYEFRKSESEDGMNKDQIIHLDALITAFGNSGYDCGDADMDEKGCEDLYRQKHAKYERTRAALRLYAINPTNRPTDEQIALEIERNTGIKPA